MLLIKFVVESFIDFEVVVDHLFCILIPSVVSENPFDSQLIVNVEIVAQLKEGLWKAIEILNLVLSLLLIASLEEKFYDVIIFWKANDEICESVCQVVRIFSDQMEQDRSRLFIFFLFPWNTYLGQQKLRR